MKEVRTDTVNKSDDNTFWTEVASWTLDGVIDDHYTIAVVTEVAGWTQLTRPLTNHILVPAAWAQCRYVCVLHTVVPDRAWIGRLDPLTRRAVVTSTAVTLKWQQR